MTTEHAGDVQHAEASADPRRWWALGAVCVATFMLLLDITIVNVALPDIAKDLRASFSDLQWVIDAYALSLATFTLTMGSLADHFGRRAAFAVATVMLIAFVVVELRVRDPMLDLQLFSTPAFTGAQIAAFGLSSSMFAMFLYLTHPARRRPHRAHQRGARHDPHPAAGLRRTARRALTAAAWSRTEGP